MRSWRAGLAPTLLSMSIMVIACGPLQQALAGPCGAVAAKWGQDFSVVGSFETTTGRLREAYPDTKTLIDPSIPDSTPALLCFVDGDFPITGPPQAGGQGAGYGRAIIASIAGVATLLEASERERLPVQFPPASS